MRHALVVTQLLHEARSAGPQAAERRELRLDLHGDLLATVGSSLCPRPWPGKPRGGGRAERHTRP
ncbi:MAG TPA: hypothetical protein VFO47_08475, partial [Actinomycetes bacterium]|nr:hypothetical protein [Actinomycetes bacterium]